MSDELNPYPGNLKRHEVKPFNGDKDAFREMLIEHLEAMEDPFDTLHVVLSMYRTALRRVSESSTKKDELIQRLVDASSKIRHWHDAHDGGMIVSGDSVRGLWSALAAVAEQGFKPTEE